MIRLGFAILLLAGTVPAAADYARGLAAYGSADYAVAAREFRASAEADDSESQYMLGRLCAMGLGVPQDFVAAWRWYDRAASQGHAQAAEARHSIEGILTGSQLAEARAGASPPPPPATSPQAAEEGQLAESGAARPVLLDPRSGRVIEQ